MVCSEAIASLLKLNRFIIHILWIIGIKNLEFASQKSEFGATELNAVTTAIIVHLDITK